MEDKKDVLRELYALRAGLSAISVEYEKVRAIESTAVAGLSAVSRQMNQVVNEQQDVMRQKFRNSDPIYYMIPNACGLWEESEDPNQNIINYGKWLADDKSKEYYAAEYNNAVEEKKTGNNFNLKKKRLYSGLFWGFLLLAIVVVSVAIALGVNRVISFLGTLALIAVGVLIFFVSMYFYVGRKDYKVSYKREKQRSTERLAIHSGLYNAYLAAHEKAVVILRKRNEQIAPLKEVCSEFYLALQKQFSHIIDDRDWKNLDLVVFELETRRADTIKEALQLVDRELQTERLEKTITLAAEQICREIKQGFSQLNNTIIECSKQICAQLTVMNFQLMEIRGQLGELTDAVNLGNALQAKANETSAQIMSDVNAIRYYGV